MFSPILKKELNLIKEQGKKELPRGIFIYIKQ